MAKDWVRFKDRRAFLALIKQLPPEWQPDIMSLLESVVFRSEIEDYVGDVTNAGTVDHTNLTNIGTNTHAQIDTHIADSTIHFTEASIDHTNIQNIGTYTHAQIDNHIDHNTGHPNQVVSSSEPADSTLDSLEGCFWYEN